MTGDIASMTGFARADGASDGWRWNWELKSVNGRGLEMRFRLPPGYDDLEPRLRKALQAQAKRGSFYAGLNLRSEASAAPVRINETALQDMIAAVNRISVDAKCAPPQAEGILALRGVLEQAEAEPDEDARAALLAALEESFVAAVDKLRAARLEEGAALAAVVAGQFDEIESMTSVAAAHAEATPAAIRARIDAQLRDLLSGGPIPEDRLAQEAAMLAVKADIREELDRLHAHVEAGRALLARGGATGRELDFLSQEFNREANTLCSKAQQMDLKRIGLDLKKTIDQLREQIQNIE